MSRFRLCRNLIVLVGLVLMAVPAQAVDCTPAGASLTYTCGPATTPAQVASMISRALDGATATFVAGSYSWSSGINFTETKGITLICESTPPSASPWGANASGCLVSASGNLGIGLHSCATHVTKTYRISGFQFTGGSNIIQFEVGYPTHGCQVDNVRVDHNSFINQGDSQRILLFDTFGSNIYGVVDHNRVASTATVVFSEHRGDSDAFAVIPNQRGTLLAMFYEDNDIRITTMTNSGAGCLDSTDSPAIVWRRNYTLNCLLTSHGALPTSGGSTLFEVYDNTFVQNSGSDVDYRTCERCFHHQGSGEMYIFNNTFTPATTHGSASALTVHHYRSASPSEAGYSGAGQCDGTTTGYFGDGNRTPITTYYGYPCHRQPGRDINATLRPIYVWNNIFTDDGAKADLSCQLTAETPPPSACTHHVVANRDYFNAVGATVNICTSPPGGGTCSPFNGTIGMGFGTLANRPNSCSRALTDSHVNDVGYGGVGYFATDVGPTGTLYHCGATNTWSVTYSPYPYPHPLVGGADTTPPAAPTGVTISQVVE